MKKKWKIVTHGQGFTLVELMVAMTIGLFLTAAIGGIYVSNVVGFRAQDDDSRLQETVRGALDTLGYHIRLAGYVDVATDIASVRVLTSPGNISFFKKQDASTDDLLSKFFGPKSTQYKTGTSYIHAVRGCEGLFDEDTFTTFPWGCTTSGSSSITLSYQVQPTTVATPGIVRTSVGYLDSLRTFNGDTGDGADCGGQDVNGGTASPAGPLAINRFYVDAETKRLMCRGSGNPGKPRPIAEGVEDMRILYGITPTTVSLTASNDSFVGRYVTADSVTDWSNVLAVRVCLQFVAPGKTGSVTKYIPCNGTTAETTTDGKTRQVVRATFSLRNNVFTVPDALP